MLFTEQEKLTAYGEPMCQGIADAPLDIKRELKPAMKEVFSSHKDHLQTPSVSNPVKEPAERCLVLLCDELGDAGLRDNDDGDMRRIPYVDDFLGVCGEGPTVSGEREFVAKLPDFHSTGLYARPDADIVVSREQRLFHSCFVLGHT